MFNTFKRLTILALLASLVLATAANAQTKQQPPQNAIQLNLRPGNGASQAGNMPQGGISPQWSIGWNSVYIDNCQMFTSGSYTFLIAYTYQGGYFYTVYPAYQTVIAGACQLGNELAFHITDNNGDWDQVYTFPW